MSQQFSNDVPWGLVLHMPVELWVAQELPYEKARGKTKDRAICLRPLDTYPYHDTNQSISVFI